MQPLLLLVLLTLSAPALAIYKCDSGGRTVYSDTPCSNGKGVALDINTRPSGDPEDAQQKLSQEKQELRRIENLRQKQEAADLRERRKLYKASEVKKKKCADLALRKKWAEEDARSAHPKSEERARRTARRAAEKHDLECAA
jgi:hypothetical protein